jgi:hypothetical protein
MRARTTLAAILLTASAAYLSLRHLPNPFPRKPDFFALDPDQKQLLKDARAAFAPYPTLNFNDTTTPADLRAILDASPEQPVPAATAQIPATLTPDKARRLRADLHGLMAEYLLYAVIKRDPNAYASWRLGRKDRLMNMDELNRDHYIGDAWLEFTGKPMPDNATPEDCFRLVTDHLINNTPPDRRIVGILNHPDAAFTRLRFVNLHLAYTQAEPDPEPLGTHWSGSQVGTFRSYFTAGVQRSDFYSSTEPLLTARMGVILLDAGGLRHPIFLNAFWDPAQNKWILDFVNVGNHDPDHNLPLLF